ncbi:methyltransferase regulatory domain-containing protein [Campylobacter majalis]|uniref:methyltransferase regulatory domain-containing protein n=1 Tax=Campylobacter majalis TaxID=2790656 RepID=UPI003D69E39B
MFEEREYYNEAPYFSAAFTDSSPIRLNAIGELLNLNPAPLKNARILELGCAYGGNIMPFALHYPDADVVGIDISGVQVNGGNEIAKNIGLTNFKLLEKDILSLNSDDIKMLGKFDYIIAHGLYSWVRDNVKNSILALIKAVLNPNGIAYVSYNVMPGWSSFSLLREYMLFASKDEKVPSIRLQKAKDELKFLQDYLKTNLQDKLDPTLRDTQKLLLTQLNFLQNITKDNKNDYYIQHEFLETHNDPIYFKDFINKIDKVGLCYLLDSSLDDIFKSQIGVYRFDAHLNKNYKKRVDKEQMLDFMLNRSFRKSLIMHKDILEGVEDFDIDISVNEFAKLNFIADIKKQNNKFYIKDRELNPEYYDIYEKIYSKYPESQNIMDFKEYDLQKALFAFLELMLDLNVGLTTYELKDVKIKNVKLKPKIKEYLKYFYENDNPAILMANELNQKIQLSKDEIQIALKIDAGHELDMSDERVCKVMKILQKNYLLIQK